MSVRFRFDEQKAIAAVVYLASKPTVTDFDKGKAAKLLFLADKFHLVRYARPILGDEYRALDNGPVPQCALDLMHALIDPANRGVWVNSEALKTLSDLIEVDDHYHYPRLASKGIVEPQVLSASEIEALDRVAMLHGNKSFGELRALTHEMPAYSKAWEAKPADARFAPMCYEDFFEEDSDALAGAMEEMLENWEIQEALDRKR